MRANLRGRLHRLKKKSSQSSSAISNEHQSTFSEPLSLPKKSPQKKAFSSELVREDFLSGWERVAESVFYRRQSTEEFLNPEDEVPRNLRDPRWGDRPFFGRDLFFYDTETTGLSGGAGNIPFLVGWSNRGVLHQLFLTDYGGEPEMLSFLKDFFPSDALYVSYNGMSFDRHLVETRFLMNGIDFCFPYQLDLLHWTRRVWKGQLERYPLGRVEEALLKISRTEDIPGSEIPDTYFRFLDSGNPSPLIPVVEHHSQDIRSLIRLYRMIVDRINDPDSFPEEDLSGVGFFLARNRRGDPFPYLNSGCRRGNPQAFLEAARCYKRNREYVLWQNTVLEGLSSSPCYGLFRERALYLEHRKGDYPAGLHLLEACRAVLKNLEPRDEADWEKRKRRLIFKSSQSTPSKEY